MKNKKIIVALAVFISVILIGGIYFVLTSKGAPKEEPTSNVQAQPTEEPVLTLLPEDIGLSLQTSNNNRKVILEVTEVDDILSLDYELSYMSKGDIPRGAIGNIAIESKAPIRQEIVLGTCSDVCHYDEDVSDIKVVLKVNKADNKVYSVEKSLEI